MVNQIKNKLQHRSERIEFGHFSSPLLITILVLLIYVFASWFIDAWEIHMQRQEYLKYYTPRGERYTFGNENYNYEVKSK